jgi:hypothetical protein
MYFGKLERSNPLRLGIGQQSRGGADWTLKARRFTFHTEEVARPRFAGPLRIIREPQLP